MSSLAVAAAVIGAVCCLKGINYKTGSFPLAANSRAKTVADAEEFSRNVVLQAGEGRSVLAVDTGRVPLPASLPVGHTRRRKLSRQRDEENEPVQPRPPPLHW